MNINIKNNQDKVNQGTHKEKGLRKQDKWEIEELQRCAVTLCSAT